MPDNRQKADKKELRINEEIVGVSEVRILIENGETRESKVVPIAEALRMAEEQGVDLIEISPNAKPPVCKIMEYQKYQYQQKRREKEMKANSVKMVVKEVRFGPQTDDHDYNFKLKHAQEFIKDGNKVRAYVFFKGRSIRFKEQGEEVLNRLAQDLEDIAKVDSKPALEGKKMIMMFSPKSTKK